ncbi:sarcinarray family MAST domain-containing protein [Methanolobus sp. WCC1]|jgi:sarcinarray family protein|uniref:sarcinarray family MAST domain-containing protein n=1 Tax=unclassified Methanolobus TaxID=2629569 RepID=UPI0032562261
MNKKLVAVALLIHLLVLPGVSYAASNIDVKVYYNDQLYPGASTPKPLLKIGEPFTLRFDVTSFNKGYLSVKLTELGDNSFKIIDGPILKMDEYSHTPIEKNETISYEWTLETTDEWAGGSMPLDFIYQLNDYDTFDLLVQGEFTAAYVTISEEYYDGSESATESTSNPEDESSSPSTPAFTALSAVFVLAVVAIYKRK